MQGRFLLDVVVGQGTAIFQLLSGEDQTLLVWKNQRQNIIPSPICQIEVDENY